MALPKSYRHAETAQKCANCGFLGIAKVRAGKRWCFLWDDYVELSYTCNKWKPIKTEGKT